MEGKLKIVQTFYKAKCRHGNLLKSVCHVSLLNERRTTEKRRYSPSCRLVLLYQLEDIPSICLNGPTHSKRRVSRKTPSPFAQLPERPENYINKCDSRILFYRTALQSLAHCSLMFNERVFYPSHQYSRILNTQKNPPQLVLPQNFQV